MRLFSAIALVLLLPMAGLADSRGAVRVVDADTFDVGGVRVRLHGVDAPEAGQTCEDATGTSWACGDWATDWARSRWQGRTAICDLVEMDRFGREVSRCEVSDEDVGAALVRSGVAVAYRRYSLRYVDDESVARALGAGLWQGRFEAPAEVRKGARDIAVTPTDVSGECLIKGNISRNGRIYHLPGQAFYGETRIDSRAGERWFCSAGEAVAAGWRAARG